MKDVFILIGAAFVLFVGLRLWYKSKGRDVE